MVKTTERDIRIMKRNSHKMHHETLQIKRNATAFRKMVSSARDVYHKRFYCLRNENLILLQSLKNFNKTCNQQKMMLRKQKQIICKTKKAADELKRLKRSLKSIKTRKRSNHCVNRVADI